MKARFDGLNRVQAPNLWPEITERAAVPARAPWLLRFGAVEMAIATAVIVAAIAIGFVATRGDVGGPPSASPQPSEQAQRLTKAGPVTAGRYLLVELTWGRTTWPDRVAVTIPDGWAHSSIRRGSDLTRGDAAALDVGTVGNLVATPCWEEAGDSRPDGFNPPVGRSVADLAAAIGDIPGLEATPSRPVTLAGFAGRYLEFDVSGAECDRVDLWGTEPDSRNYVRHVITSQDWHHHVWILEVDGQRFVIDASYSPTASQSVRDEVLAIVQSMEIEP